MTPSSPTGSQMSQIGRSHSASNAYAPWVPSPLNPNPKEHVSPRASRRIIRRVAKPSSSQPVSPQQQQQQQAQLRKQMRSVSTTERLLRRKFEEALRVHHLIEQRNGAPITQAKLHRVASQAQRSQRSSAGLGSRASVGAKTTSSHASMRHYSISDPEKRELAYEYDEWSLDPVDNNDMEEIDLDLLERKLGIGWQEEAPVAEVRQMPEDTKRRLRRFKMLGGALRRPTKGVLLAVALVCLCGLPALRGQASVLRRIGSFAMGL